MSKREDTPKVNAGSMADIAFLLLIFFLVTTSIETDKGLDRMLPRWNEEITEVDVHERNILSILIDKDGKLMVDEKITDIQEVREIAIAFLDNGGAVAESGEFCSYCKGLRDPNASDNPDKAIISLTSNRETDYADYITVQNELVGAYHFLRNREAMRLFKTNYAEMEALYAQKGIAETTKKALKKKIESIQGLYPMKLLEAESK